MTTPLSDIVAHALRAMSLSEPAFFMDDQQRERIARAVVEAYYAGSSGRVVYDTSRAWTNYSSLLLRMFPDSWLICCVRSPAWIVDSIERLIQKNPLLVTRLFHPT